MTFRLLALVAVCTALSGCFYPAYQAFQSPATVEPFRFEPGPELGATAGMVVDTTNYGGDSLRMGMTDLAGIELGLLARLGIARNLDVGLRLAPGLLGLADVKYRFLSGPVNAAAGLGVSFYPRTGSLYSASHVGGVAFYPVLAAGTERFFGGLRAVVLQPEGDLPGPWQFSPGAYVGASPGERVKVMPEFDVLVINQPGRLQNSYRSLLSAGAGLALALRI